MDKVVLRLLEEADAAVSWKWRNDAEVWQYTRNSPSAAISYEMEMVWIREVLQRKDEIRFAICLKETGAYVGNVQLTNINGYDAAFHLFIGEKRYWGMGFGTEATRLVLQYGFESLGLQSIYLDVKKTNTGAIKVYRKAGFSEVFEYGDYSRMAIFLSDRIEKKLSVFVMAYNHGSFIEEALKGILMQETNFEYDIVVGDDFSTDETRSILIRYALQHPGKFKLLLYPQNVSAVRNQLWVFKNCLGKYIAMCEGDDFWIHKLKLQQQVDFLDSVPSYSGAFHETKVLDELNTDEKKMITKVYGANLPDTISAEDTISQWSLFHTSSFVFRNSALVIPEWFKSIDSADMALFSIIAASGPLRKISGVMSVYRKHPGGITETAALKNNLYQNRIQLAKYLNQFHGLRYEAKVKEIILLHQSALDGSLPVRNKPGLYNRISDLFSAKTKK